jgi:hypothetical protein
MAPKHHPTPLSGGDLKALKKELTRARAMTGILADRAAEKRAAGEVLLREAGDLVCQSWNERMWSDGGPADPSPSIDQAINGGYGWLEIRCSRCRSPRSVDLCQLPHVAPAACTTSPAGYAARAAAPPASARPPSCCSCRAGRRPESLDGLPHPPPGPRPRQLLAYLFHRRACRHHRAPRRCAARRRSMGMAMRLLSGVKARRADMGQRASFDLARDGFEKAWRVFSSRRTEAAYQAWRDQRDWTARKYAMWDRRTFSDIPSRLMKSTSWPLAFSHAACGFHRKFELAPSGKSGANIFNAALRSPIATLAASPIFQI